MTDEQIEQWKRERDIARAIEDDKDRSVALQKVYDHRDEMQMRCICHQSRRQKEMVEDIKLLQTEMGTVKHELIPLKALNQRTHDWRERIKGGKALLRILKALGAVGVGAGLAKGIDWSALARAMSQAIGG